MYTFEDDNCTIKNIEYVRNIYEAQKVKVKNEKYIEELLLRDYVATIRKNTSKYDYIDIFEEARKELGEKLKKNRKNIATIESFILHDFLGDDKNFKLVNILQCGYENYAWAVEFEGYGVLFRIDIPVKKNLTTENIIYAHHGMFAFTVNTSKASWTVMKSSYLTDDIAAAVTEYFEQVKAT